MNKMIVIICAAAVAGCASTQEVLDGPAKESYHSTISAAEVAFCIADKNNVPALERGDGSRVVLIKNSVGAVGIAFTITPHGTGSTIELRKKIGLSAATWRQCVGEPQNG